MTIMLGKIGIPSLQECVRKVLKLFDHYSFELVEAMPFDVLLSLCDKCKHAPCEFIETECEGEYFARTSCKPDFISDTDLESGFTVDSETISANVRMSNGYDNPSVVHGDIVFTDRVERVLYVTYCCKSKQVEDRLMTPVELYQCDRVRCFFANFNGKYRAILSYKYGLIMDFEKIYPYDQNTFMDFDFCVQRMESACFMYGITRIVFYSPRKLTEKPWIRLLDAVGLPYTIVRSIKEVANHG